MWQQMPRKILGNFLARWRRVTHKAVHAIKILRQLLGSRPRRDVVEVQQRGAAGDSAPACIEARGVRVDYEVPLPGLRGWLRKGHFTAVHALDFTRNQQHCCIGKNGGI